MTQVFKPILEQMAAGDLEHVYADVVIHMDKEEIIWNQTDRQTGTISVYSRNDIPVMGTVSSLHPAVFVKENCFQGNTIIHYECRPESVLFLTDSVQEGILICCNGRESVIPIRFQTADSVERERKESNPESNSSIVHDSSIRPELRSVSEEHRNLRHTQAQFARKIMELFSCRKLEKNPEKTGRLMQEAGSMVQTLIQCSPNTVRYQLYGAVFYVLLGEQRQAAQMESRVRNVVTASRKKYSIEYCYLLYLQYQIACANGQMKEAEKKKIRMMEYIQLAMDRNPADFDLPLLLCSDGIDMEKLDLEELWEVLKYMHRQGNNSPYLYLAGAFLIHNSEGAVMVREKLDLWITGCLRYALKYGFLTEHTAKMAADMRPDVYRNYHWHLLEKLYLNFPLISVFSAFCTALIRCDIRRESVFCYYEKAVEDDLKIARLYDYYMYSLPADFDKPINREVLLYFSLDEYVNPQIYIRICLNVVEFYEDDMQILPFFQKGMDRFVRKQILRKNWSQELAMLAGIILEPDQVDEELAQALIPMLYLVQVQAQLPDGFRIMYDSGIYKEPQVGIIQNEKTCLSVPGGTGSFRIADRDGNPVSGIRLLVMKLMENEELMHRCESLCPEDPFLLLIKTHYWLEQGMTENCDLPLCFQYLRDDSLADHFRKLLLAYLLEQANHAEYGDEEIQTLMRYTNWMDQNQIMEWTRTLIEKGYHREAVGFLFYLSPDNFPMDSLQKLAEELVDRPINIEETTFLLFLLKQEAADNDLLSCLSRSYRGHTSLMIQIYQWCCKQQISCEPLVYRLLLRLLMTETADLKLMQELLSQIINNENAKLLSTAVINRICYEYVCEKSVSNEIIPDYIEAEMIHSGGMEALSVPCQLACLKYNNEFGMNHDLEKEMVKEMCRRMLDAGIHLDFLNRQAAEFGMEAFPMFQINLGLQENSALLSERNTGASVSAEYRIDGAKQIYSVPAHHGYALFYYAPAAVFAGENVQYRFLCGKAASPWISAGEWNFEPAKVRNRYQNLQRISVSVKNRDITVEQLKNYSVAVMLADSIGRNIK
ncbi:MAG: DUF5717 family protein [Lachnospiraceae bacterium]